MTAPRDARWKDALVATLRATPGALEDGCGVAAAGWTRLGGNALTSVWKVDVGGKHFFVKSADDVNAEMLGAEADALQAIAETRAIRVPQVFAIGHAETAAFLAMEWLDIVDGGRDAALGRALAQMHGHVAPAYGWHRDNTIGNTPQCNAWDDDWATFFRERRLAPQFALAARNGHAGRLATDGARVLAGTAALLEGHRPAASLLHGDLWAGNAARLADGTPVVFDPSTYYGDREVDLAMTELFGGFAPGFYEAYTDVAPLPAGHEVRATLYNLYHVLNHLNLFGTAYLARAEAMTVELAAFVA